MKLYHALSTALVAAYTALTLMPLGTQYAASKPRHQYETYSEGWVTSYCVITGKWEDGARTATCLDGTLTIAFDPDGLGPYCPRTGKRFGSQRWHTTDDVKRAYKHCEREIKRKGR